jgi:NADH-quinone oxidoreductase subunit L
MAQFDIKRIMAYSTVSQLGYMFAGLGFLTTTGAAFHVFTHAFFKATLFLACGAVMHGFAGQLDLRKLSGLWSQPGWKIVTLAMFIGCINLAGVPFTAGYFSKDMILAEAFVTPGKAAMGWILLATAGLTAYYTFRVFFRVFVGPVHFEAGDEAHSHGDDDHGHGHGEEHHHDPGQHGDHHHPHFHPHPPGWAINLVLATLAIGSVVAAGTYFIDKDHHGWVGGLLHRSTASYTSPYGHHDAAHAMAVADVVIVPVADAHGGEAVAEAAHAGAGGFLGMDPHKVMYYVSAVVGLIGILTAAFLHGPRGIGGLLLGNRTEAATSRADGLLPMLGPIPKWAQHKWYVDELYHAIIVAPLWVLSNIFHLIDRVLVDGLVNVAGWAPTALAKRMRVTQDGRMHTYATGMGVGLAAVLIVVLVVVWSTGGNG